MRPSPAGAGSGDGSPSFRWKKTSPPAIPYPTAGSVTGARIGTNPVRVLMNRLMSKARPRVGEHFLEGGFGGGRGCRQEENRRGEETVESDVPAMADYIKARVAWGDRVACHPGD